MVSSHRPTHPNPLYILCIAGDLGGFRFLQPVRESLVARGHRLHCLVGEKLARHLEDMNSVSAFDGRLTHENLDDCLSPLNASQPTFDAVVAGVSRESDTEKQAILKAKRLGIPTFGVVDTWSHFLDRFSDEDTHTGRIFNHLKYLPDQVFLVDHFAQSGAIQEGLPSDRLLVTGSPHLEGLRRDADQASSPEAARLARDTLRHQLGIKPGPPIVLFASEAISHYFPPGHRLHPGFTEVDAISGLAEAIRAYGKPLRLMARPHPFQSDDSLNDYSKRFKDLTHIARPDISSYDAIRVADAVVGMTSMLLVEAVVLGRPVISYQPQVTHGAMWGREFIGIKQALVTGCYDQRELVDKLRLVLESHSCMQAPIGMTTVVDQITIGATERVIAAIEQRC